MLLYNAPPSFYSQIARLVLHEKGVLWRTKVVFIGPPTFESYEPWYTRTVTVARLLLLVRAALAWGVWSWFA